jgi:hypothetical protein
MPCTFGDAPYHGAAREASFRGTGFGSMPLLGSRDRALSTFGQSNASTFATQGGSRVPESGSLGSERGVPGNGHPYRKQASVSASYHLVLQVHASCGISAISH